MASIKRELSRNEMKRRELLRRNMSIEHAERDCEIKLARQKEQSEDTKIRYEIQEFIFKKHVEGKSSEEVIEMLKSIYGEEKYASYQPYFETWVRKYEKPQEKADKGEER